MSNRTKTQAVSSRAEIETAIAAFEFAKSEGRHDQKSFEAIQPWLEAFGGKISGQDWSGRPTPTDPAYIVAAILWCSENNKIPADQAAFFNGCLAHYKANGWLTQGQTKELADSPLHECVKDFKAKLARIMHQT